VQRLGIIGLLLTLVTAACTTSEIDPGADVEIGGRIIGPDGTPASAEAVLLREPNPTDVIGGLGAGMLTWGLACTVEPEPRLCDEGNVRRASTGSDGAFGFELTGRDTQDTLGFANRFIVSAVLPAALPAGDSSTGRSSAGLAALLFLLAGGGVFAFVLSRARRNRLDSEISDRERAGSG
jgi:hypothetical protein